MILATAGARMALSLVRDPTGYQRNTNARVPRGSRASPQALGRDHEHAPVPVRPSDLPEPAMRGMQRRSRSSDRPAHQERHDTTSRDFRSSRAFSFFFRLTFSGFLGLTFRFFARVPFRVFLGVPFGFFPGSLFCYFFRMPFNRFNERFRRFFHRVGSRCS